MESPPCCQKGFTAILATVHTVFTMANIRKLPSGKWNVQVRRRGIKPLTKTFMTRAAAEKWARMTETDLDNKSFKDLSIADRTQFIELVRKYQELVTPKKRSSRRELSRMKILVKEFGSLAVSAITPERVLSFLNKRLEEVSSTTAKKDLITLSLIIDAGEVWGIPLQSNPVKSAKRIMKTHGDSLTEASRDRRLNRWEIKRLFRESSVQLKALIIWAIESAMRRGEIAKMKKRDRVGDLLKIPETKTDVPRVIPVTKHMRRVWGYLPFGITDDAISRAFSRACQRAGIEGLRFHDLRHEATSRLFEKGLQIHEVAAITGHSDWASLKRYTHPDVNRLREKLGG